MPEHDPRENHILDALPADERVLRSSHCCAGKLQALGAIKYGRGRITVLDRPKLEKLSCEYYAVVKEETDRLRSPHALV